MGSHRCHPREVLCALVAVVAILIPACVTQRAGSGELHRWWAGFGPVLPHERFPADCSLCHVGEDWNTLQDDFVFDHESSTGVRLEGAHAEASCLRCHNDRGPVAVFQARGCAGCHEDVHTGDLGPRCETCHDQRSWRAGGRRGDHVARHTHTRFPLTGAHLATACHRCHAGADVGNFAPADTECVTCHGDDLAGTTNPPHIPLGWVDHCNRCHMPTSWNRAIRR